MKNNTKLIVMLTNEDKTVRNAYEIFEACRNSKAEFWGFKEKPLPFDEMKKLYAYMKKCGKTTVLEVVAYTEKEGIEGAEMAVEFGTDLLMGTVYSDSINEICRKHGLKYMPFVGNVSCRPSILEGTVNDMLAEAKRCLEKGVYGIDLLGYRFQGNCTELIRRFTSEIKAPVCVAGSINSYERLDEIKAASPWAFTIGSAFFEHKFGENFNEQIDNVCDYINRS